MVDMAFGTKRKGTLMDPATLAETLADPRDDFEHLFDSPEVPLPPSTAATITEFIPVKYGNVVRTRTRRLIVSTVIPNNNKETNQ